jgi:drug/metabolite transporter (DMT)-like permease
VHRVSGRWPLGLALALIASASWGVVPIALKIALQRMDAYTITWYRFAVAAVVLGALLAARGSLPRVTSLDRRSWKLLLVALVGLVGNYTLYLVALQHTSPSINQVVTQLSPLFLLIGGLVVYKESFSRAQWFGLVMLVSGLMLFFNRRLPELARINSGIGLGVVLLVIAAVVWAAYALAQKDLLRRMGSPQILWLVYIGATAVMLPVAQPREVATLGWLHLGVLAFCCANTLVAYGAFAEAMEHWEVSRVSAVLAMGPIFTLIGMMLMARWSPGLLEPERLTALSVTGALMVVAGSALCAFGQSKE